MGEVGGDHFADVVAHLHSGLGDARDLAAVLLQVSEVANDEDFGKTRRIEIAVDNDAAAFVERSAEHLAKGEACTPAAQRTTAASSRLPFASTQPGPTLSTCVPV